MRKTAEHPRKSRRELTDTRAESRDMAPAVALLVIAQVFIVVADPPDGLNLANLAWALLMVAGTGGLVWVQVRSLRRVDEYQRIVRLEAMAIAFATMLVLWSVAGLLEGMGVGDLRQSTQAVVIVTVLVWAAAHEIKTRRAR